MTLVPYSSVSAFIAHCRALRAKALEGTPVSDTAARPLSPSDAEVLDEIERLLSELNEAERETLGLAQLDSSGPRAFTIRDGPDDCSAEAGQPSTSVSRRRARAELKLHRLLAAHGLLTN
jgi:hypothetical protein